MITHSFAIATKYSPTFEHNLRSISKLAFIIQGAHQAGSSWQIGKWKNKNLHTGFDKRNQNEKFITIIRFLIEVSIFDSQPYFWVNYPFSES